MKANYDLCIMSRDKSGGYAQFSPTEKLFKQSHISSIILPMPKSRDQLLNSENQIIKKAARSDSLSFLFITNQLLNNLDFVLKLLVEDLIEFVEPEPTVTYQ